jgi:hypothetical protein
LHGRTTGEKKNRSEQRKPEAAAEFTPFFFDAALSSMHERG